MKLERMVHFRIDFRKPWAQYSAALMGVFIFLRAVYFFACLDMTDVMAGYLWLHLIIPLVIAIAYIVLLHGLHFNEPVVYGVVGAAVCVLMIIYNVQCGTPLWGVFAVIWYIVSVIVLLATVLGFLPNRLYLLIAFVVAVIFQYFSGGIMGYFLDLQIGLLSREGSNLFAVAAFACLAPALVGRKGSN